MDFVLQVSTLSALVICINWMALQMVRPMNPVARSGPRSNKHCGTVKQPYYSGFIFRADLK